MEPPRPSKKRLFKGSSSHRHSETPVTALSLISDNVVDIYEKKFATRNIVKQFAAYAQTLNCMYLKDVVNLLQFQQLFPLLQFDADYNEELVKMFYASLQGDFFGVTFSYSIQNRIITIDSNTWKEFGMYPPSSDAVRITDTSVLPDFNFKNSMNSILKNPYPTRFVNSTLFPQTVTTGALCPLDRIL